MQAEQSWTGKYVLDFGRLLSDAKTNEDAEGYERDDTNDESDLDQPVFSLTTGKYRHAKQYGSVKPTDEEKLRTLEGGVSALVLRNQDGQVAKIDSAAGAFLPPKAVRPLLTCVFAGQFLQQRSYQGLDMRLGEDLPSVLEQGRSGIARGYQDDREHQDMSKTEYK
jgi:diphthamide biosynthesis protein 2